MNGRGRTVVKFWRGGRRTDTDRRVRLRRLADLARDGSEGRGPEGALGHDRKLNLHARRALLPAGCLVVRVLSHRDDSTHTLGLRVGTREVLLPRRQ